MFMLTVLCLNNRKCKRKVFIKCESIFKLDLTCGIKKYIFCKQFKKGSSREQCFSVGKCRLWTCRSQREWKDWARRCAAKCPYVTTLRRPIHLRRRDSMLKHLDAVFPFICGRAWACVRQISVIRICACASRSARGRFMCRHKQVWEEKWALQRHVGLSVWEQAGRCAVVTGVWRERGYFDVKLSEVHFHSKLRDPYSNSLAFILALFSPSVCAFSLSLSSRHTHTHARVHMCMHPHSTLAFCGRWEKSICVYWAVSWFGSVRLLLSVWSPWHRI